MSGMDASEFRRSICDLISIEKTNLGMEISTPVLYPDGEMATVVVTQEADTLLAHDGGLGAHYLQKYGMKFSRNVRARSAEATKRYGCEFVNGRVMRRFAVQHAGLGILTIANASRAIADYALEMRTTIESDFRSIVVDSLKEIFGHRVREGESIKGKSGRSYKILALVLDRSQSHPFAFVSAISRRSTIASHVTEFFDIGNAFSDILREAVYDESGDLREEDRILMRQVADLVPFTQVRHQLGRVLNA